MDVYIVDHFLRDDFTFFSWGGEDINFIWLATATSLIPINAISRLNWRWNVNFVVLTLPSTVQTIGSKSSSIWKWKMV